MRLARTLLRLLPLLLALAGCTTIPDTGPKPPPDERTRALDALNSGDYQTAARLFSSLAAGAKNPNIRREYDLYTADALIRGGFAKQGTAILDGLDEAAMSPRQRMHYQLLRASVALEQDPASALKILDKPKANAGEGDLFTRYHHIRARAYARLGDYFQAAKELVLREMYLSDTAAIESNQLAIWQALSTLSDDALARARLSPPPDALTGWVELLNIAKDFGQTPEQMQLKLQNWRYKYPGHPVRNSFLDDLVTRSSVVSRPGKIALLLPISGRFGKAAEAVRDGVLAAYYASPDRARTELRIYDVGPDPSGVLAAYQRAIDEGAQFVIGPLEKPAVQQLAQQSALPVPTLALNYAETPRNSSLYQFTLSPEDEASQVAEKAWQAGHTRAAVLVPEGALGERLRQAFEERWAQLGGRIVAQTVYSPRENDFSAPLKAMLNLDQSEDRHRRLSTVLKQKLGFVPHRRQDVDFIFLAAYPRQARAIRPQLAFHHAGDVPLYATSHVFTGKIDARSDRDMEGIIFGDMPWILDAPTPQQAVRHQAMSLLTQHRNQLERRLVAMGVDAYNLVQRLNVLDQYPYERLQGETGNLRVDAENRVRRQMLWARFVKGVPHLLENIELEPSYR